MSLTGRIAWMALCAAWLAGCSCDPPTDPGRDGGAQDDAGPRDGGPRDGGPPRGCQRAADCSDPARPICDVATRECVECLSTDRGACTVGEHCAERVCVPGCATDADCAAIGGDAMRCRVADHTCVGCVSDDQCAPGTICDETSSTCVAGCTPEHACPGAELCCGGTCFDGDTSLAHCGACGNACASGPRSTATCDGACGLLCEDGYGDCNDDAVDGCETDVTSDPDHCGGCGLACSDVNGTSSCEGSRCAIACDEGYADCDAQADNGCEVSLSAPESCGACDRSCGPGASCTAGRCTRRILATLPIPGLLSIALHEGFLYAVGNADPRIYRVSTATGEATFWRTNEDTERLPPPFSHAIRGASMRDAQVYGDRLYWTDYLGEGTLRSARLDGTGPIVDLYEVSAAGAGAGGLLVEEGVAYITTYDLYIPSVSRVDLTTGAVTVYGGVGCVYFGAGIARHPVDGRILWGCQGGHSSAEYIFAIGETTAPLWHLGAGRSVHDIITRGNDVYVTAAGEIVRIDATTGAMEVLYSTVGTIESMPIGLAIDDTTLYWVNATANIYALRLP